MPSEKKKRALPTPAGLDFVTPPRDSLVDDLRYALEHAKDLYADIAWEFTAAPSSIIIYAHKAILYARSSRSFQDRFLKNNKDANGSSIRSVRLSNPDSIVKTDADPGLVRQELKFFYTSEEGGEDFLAAVDTTDELEQVKLKEDLLYMLNVKLYTDIELVLDYSDDNLEIIEENEEAFKPIRAHRFMLYTRSDYFKKMLSSDFIEARSTSIHLDANIFDQTSLNLILTFIYTGSISSSKKPLTLDTCELVWVGADYLGIKLLCDECIHRIATKAHYFTCTCTDCQVVVPRIATFAKEQEVDMLWQGCLHVLSHGFDNMWPQKPFADLDEDTREEVLLTVLAQVQPNNIMAIFKGCRKILSNIDIKGIGLPWIETIRGMTHQVRSFTVQILVDNFEQLCNDDQEFLECVDGIGFSSDLLEDIMNIVVEEGLSEQNSVRVLKCIAGKLLTRQAVMDSENFEIKRVLVQTKQNVFDYIKKRWISVRENGGFRLLSPWLLDEFSKELGVTNQELQETTDCKETKPKARTPSVTNGLSKKGREASPVSTSKTTKLTTTAPVIVTTSPQSNTPSSSTGNKNTITTNGDSAHSPSDSPAKSSMSSARTAAKTNGTPKKGKSVRIGETTTAPVWARPTRASVLRQKALEESSAKNPIKPRTKTTTSIKSVSSSSSITSTDSTQSKSTPTSKTGTTTTRTLRPTSSASSLRVPNGTSASQRGRSTTRKNPSKQNASAASSRASSISSITSVNSPSVSPSRFGGVRQTRSSMLRQLKYDDVEQRRGRDRERGTSPSSSRASSIASTSSVTSNTTTSSHHRRKRSPSQNSTSTSITSTSSSAITSLQPKPHQVKLATVPNPVISVGKRVILPTKNNAPGTIQFLGETEFAKGVWVGIELENPVGKNNGKVANTKYFTAGANHGIFVRPDSLLLI